VRDFSQIEQDIALVLSLLVGRLSNNASVHVREYSELHGECGLALEDMLWSIEDEKVAVPSMAVEILQKLALQVPIAPGAKAILANLEQEKRAST